MQHYFAVINGDNINRKNICFTVGALEDALHSNGLTGVPSLVGHDFHRPIGWNYPLGLYFEPGLTRLIGIYLLATDEKDEEDLHNALQHSIYLKHKESCEPFISEFEGILKKYNIESYRFLYSGCVACYNTEILHKVYPFIRSLMDKDKLVHIDKLLEHFEYLGQGIFKDKKSDFAIYAHQYFRRDLSHQNNFHSIFLDQFLKLNNKKDITLRIALDSNLIGLSKTFHEQIELEFWFGPKYNDNIEEIPNGVSKHGCDELQKLFSGISTTEFYWKKKNNEFTFEVEELKERPSAGVSLEKYGCRYIHSIYNNDVKSFHHFDGAIRMYNETKMIERFDKNINKAGKYSEYTKLFRIDGKLDISDWKSLSTNYFQDNPLLYEYFGAKQEYEKLKNEINYSHEKSIREKYVPYEIDNKDGIRFFVSYHKRNEYPIKEGRILINPDILQYGEETLNIAEFEVIEVKKALKRIGEEIHLPNNLTFIKAYDYFINIPTIIHIGQKAHTLMNKTILSLINLFQAMSKRKSYTISFSLAWENDGKEQRIAILGKIEEILKWLTYNNSIPIQRIDFREWLEKQKTWLHDNYPDSASRPDLFKLIKSDGVLYMKRKPVENISNVEAVDESLRFNIQFQQNESELFNAFNKGNLKVTFSNLLEVVKCSKTGENYFTNDSSKYLDDDVFAEIHKCKLLGAHWTI